MSKFSVTIHSDTYKKLFNDTFGDPAVAQKFVAEISTVVSNNPKLQDCDIKTTVSAGMLAQSLNLPLAPTLGFAYVIPYGNKATFQIGWKGLVQLAIRTGYYERIGVKPVHKGELAGLDEFGDTVIKFREDCENNPIVGYFAYFKLTNGFVKTLYWSKEQCEKHGKQYSQEFKNGRGKWVEAFDEMSMKTVLKQLISKWGIMSTELTTAVQADQAVVKDNNEFEYVDNEKVEEKKKTTIKNKLADVEVKSVEPEAELLDDDDIEF